jgi:16S rRNA (guanine966-N2)-methyltransferase
MRIIGGKFGGRRINPPHLSPTRPTTDYAREGLFNILENNFDLSTVSFLDFFGGTGCISYEMASRGCNDITTVDKHYECIAFMKKTIAELDIPLLTIATANLI